MKFNAKFLSGAALIAALYTVLCLFLRPISYGIIQFRVSEALCVLPIFMPEAALGLFIGCFLSNLLGGGTAVLLDMVLGSLTTFCAALLTRRVFLKTKSYILSLLPPVVLNALIVGTYVPFLYTDMTSQSIITIILSSIVSIFISEAIVIYVLGLPFAKYLNKMGIFKI